MTTTPHKDDSLPLNGCHQHMQYLPDCEDCKFRQPKDDSQLDELDHILGLCPADGHQPCSFNPNDNEYEEKAKVQALIAKAVQEARIEENDLGWHHQKHIEKTGVSKWFVDRIAALQAEGDV